MASKIPLPCPQCGKIPAIRKEFIHNKLRLWPIPINGCRIIIICDCGNVMISPTRSTDRQLEEERKKLIKRWNRYAIVPEYWHK